MKLKEFDSSFFNPYIRTKEEWEEHKPKVVEVLQRATTDVTFRRAICIRSIFAFIYFYLPGYAINKFAKLHFKMMYALEHYKRVMFITGRGLMKTTLVIVWTLMKTIVGNSKFSGEEGILYGKSNIWWSAAKGELAKKNTTKIANELQGNKDIIRDFGTLWKNDYFYDEELGELSQSGRYGMGGFDTNNGVSITATVSRGDALRGDTSGRGEIIRPDLVISDDFQFTGMTDREKKLTLQFFDTLLGGQTGSTQVILLMNRATPNGPGDIVEQRFRALGPGVAIVIESPTLEKDEFGNYFSVWDDRIKMTDKQVREAQEEIDKLLEDQTLNKQQRINLLKKREQGFISIEQMRIELGDKFDQEVLNIPYIEGGRLFDSSIINQMIKEARTENVMKGEEVSYDFIHSGWNFYERRKKSKRTGKECEYILGCDVGSGTGGDSSTIVVYNMTTRDVAAVWESNKNDYFELTDEIIKASDYFFGAMIVVEHNSIGSSVDTLLEERGYLDRIKWRMEYNKLTKKHDRKFWMTTKDSKPKMLLKVKEMVESGLIGIKDIGLLQEMLGYGKSELDHGDINGDMSGHFDRLIGLCIAVYNSPSSYNYNDTSLTATVVKTRKQYKVDSITKRTSNEELEDINEGINEEVQPIHITRDRRKKVKVLRRR